MKKELHNLYCATKPDLFLAEPTLARGWRIQWNNGEVIFPRDGICYIYSGTVRIACIMDDGQRKTLMLAGKGHFLHEINFFHKKSGDTEITALGPVVCYFFPADVVWRLLAEDTDFRNAVLFSMAAKMSTQTIDLLLTVQPGELRMFYLLGAIAEHSGLECTVPVDLQITQNELADCLGFHRTSVNRLLKELENRGLIRCLRGRITLQSMDFWKKNMSG